MITKYLIYSLRLQLFVGFVLWNFIKCDCPFPKVEISNGGFKYDKDSLNKLSNAPERYILYFRCFDGYERKGSRAIQCWHGEWYGNIPSCEAMQCSAPPTISNGTYNFTAKDKTKITIGTQAIYSCDLGYKLSDRFVSRLTCMLDEQDKEETLWAGDIPTCQAMKPCPDPGISKNGTREGDCCFAGDIVGYYCNEGFEMVGEEEIECLSSGHWSSPRPLCKPLKKKHCELPPEIPNGVVLMKSGDYALAYEEAEIQCKPGYKLNETNQYPYCNRSALWEDEFGECVEIFCDPPEPLANGNIPELDKSNYTDIFPYNFLLTYDCDEGYRLKGGDSWSVCNKDGWSGITPHCEEIFCPDPGAPEHGAKLGNSFKVGAKVIFSCFAGYELLGSYERYCTPNGKWTGELARCNAPTNYCPNPGIPINGMRNGNSYNEGDTVVFSCASGLIHSGSTERTCMPDGTWNGTETKCFSPHDFDSIEDIGPSFKQTLQGQFDDEIRDYVLSLYAQGINPNSGNAVEYPKNGRLIMHFAFDVSGSIQKENFKKAKEFAKAIVEKIQVTEDRARAGALIFSNEAVNIFFPMQFKTTEEVLVQLDNIEYLGGGTATTSALQEVINNIKLIENQEEFKDTELKHVLFLITDGKANMGGSPEKEARILKEIMNVQIFCIGITGDVRASTLHQIASSSKYGKDMRQDVFILKNYERLNWLIQNITEGTIDYGQCGIGMESKLNRQAPRMIGGEAATEPWPWMASLFFRNFKDKKEKPKLKCGGSIINEHFILTAAHCLYERDRNTLKYRKRSAEEIIVKLGLVVLKNETLMREFEVENFYIHEDYIMDNYFDNDIALLKLTVPILYGPFTRPICLPPAVLPEDDNYPLYKPKEYGWVIGFGHEKKIRPDDILPNVEISKKLKELRLPIQTDLTCISSLTSPGAKEKTKSFTERMFCAGDGVSGNDTCRGDSGGPFMQHHMNSQGQVYWTQAGIVSWGRGCGNKDHYGFYTKLHKFRTWIDDKIKENGPKVEKK